MRKVAAFMSMVLVFASLAFAQNNTVIFDNQSGEPALVRLAGPSDTEIEVSTGLKRTVNAAVDWQSIIAEGKVFKTKHLENFLIGVIAVSAVAEKSKKIVDLFAQHEDSVGVGVMDLEQAYGKPNKSENGKYYHLGFSEVETLTYYYGSVGILMNMRSGDIIGVSVPRDILADFSLYVKTTLDQITPRIIASNISNRVEKPMISETNVVIKGIISNYENIKNSINKDSYLQLISISEDGKVNLMIEEGSMIYKSELAKIKFQPNGTFMFNTTGLDSGKTYMIAAQRLDWSMNAGCILSSIDGKWVQWQLPKVDESPVSREIVIDLGKVHVYMK